MTGRGCFLLFLAALSWGDRVWSAPLDELMTTSHTATEIEVGFDQVNRTVDIFRIRDSDPLASGTTLGDYSGYHVMVGRPSFGGRAWIDGSLWQRKLNIATLGAQAAHISSWSVAGQYRLAAQLGRLPELSLRLGAWGNHAGSISKDSATSFNGFTVGKLEVINPRDREMRANVIAAWSAGKLSRFSVFAGVDKSDVDFDQVRAYQNSCQYVVTTPSPEQILLDTQSRGCDATLIQNLGAFAPKYNINMLRYRARSSHFGGSYSVIEGRWRFRAGIRSEHIHRDLDNEILAAGGTAMKQNTILTGEMGYRLAERVGLLVRGHYFARQLNGEIPFTYNALTADKFNHRYGMVTTALVFEIE